MRARDDGVIRVEDHGDGVVEHRFAKDDREENVPEALAEDTPIQKDQELNVQA